MSRTDTASLQTTNRVNERVLDVCSAVGAFIESWGFKSIHGRVWTMLALSTHPLSQSEVADRLGVSRSLVHLAVNELADFALVRPQSTQRNARYEARMDVWPIITGVLRKREWMLIEAARVALEALRLDLSGPQPTPNSSPYDLRRVEVLLLMTELAQASLKGIFALRIPSSLEEFASWLRKARTFVDNVSTSIAKIIGRS